MNRPATDPSASEPTATYGRSRLRFELIFASVWLAVGLFVMPAVIFGVGVSLLGPYGDGKGLGTFYANFFADLAEPSGRTWLIALGPLLLVSVLRAAFLRVRKTPDEDDATRQPPRPRRSAPEHTRVEPRIGLD
jgi:hypothetical protein